MKKEKKEYNIKTRRAVSASLRDFDYLAKEHDFIEVTEWTNLDGFDITINEKVMSFTHGELDAIKKLVKLLNKS